MIASSDVKSAPKDLPNMLDHFSDQNNRLVTLVNILDQKVIDLLGPTPQEDSKPSPRDHSSGLLYGIKDCQQDYTDILNKFEIILERLNQIV